MMAGVKMHLLDTSLLRYALMVCCPPFLSSFVLFLVGEGSNGCSDASTSVVGMSWLCGIEMTQLLSDSKGFSLSGRRTLLESHIGLLEYVRRDMSCLCLCLGVLA